MLLSSILAARGPVSQHPAKGQAGLRDISSHGNITPIKRLFCPEDAVEMLKEEHW